MLVVGCEKKKGVKNDCRESRMTVLGWSTLKVSDSIPRELTPDVPELSFAVSSIHTQEPAALGEGHEAGSRQLLQLGHLGTIFFSK